MRSTCLAIVLVTLPSAPALAQQPTHFWVDAVNGIDTNPGTAQLPFQSITKGMAVAQQDAVVHVLPGLYGPTQTGEQFGIQIGTSSPAKRVKLLGTAADQCIVDFGAQPAPAAYYLQVWGLAEDIEIAHLTFRNGVQSPWNAAAIGWQDCKNLHVHHCVFTGVVSGLIGWRGAQGTVIHDNVLHNCGVAIRFRMEKSTWGARDSWLYNNLIYGCTGAAVSLSNDEPTQVCANNIALANGGVGFTGGGSATGPAPVFEGNCAFGNGTEYNVPFTLAASNLTVDPQLVAPQSNDWHLQAGSPCIEAGYPVGLPQMVNDFYGGARVNDADGDLLAAPDIGVHEVSTLSLGVSNFGQGRNATFGITTALPTISSAIFLFGARPATYVLQPIGSLTVDLTALVMSPALTVPTNLTLPIPSSPALTGIYAYVQVVGLRATTSGVGFAPSGRHDLLF